MGLEIEFNVESDERKSVSLAGSLDTETAPHLQYKLDEEIDSAVQFVVMDLKDLEFLSSAGIRVIFKTKKLLDAQQGKLLLVHLQPQVRKVFDIIKVHDIMDVFNNQAELDDYLMAMQNKVLDKDS